MPNVKFNKITCRPSSVHILSHLSKKLIKQEISNARCIYLAAASNRLKIGLQTSTYWKKSTENRRISWKFSCKQEYFFKSCHEKLNTFYIHDFRTYLFLLRTFCNYVKLPWNMFTVFSKNIMWNFCRSSV